MVAKGSMTTAVVDDCDDDEVVETVGKVPKFRGT